MSVNKTIYLLGNCVIVVTREEPFKAIFHSAKQLTTKDVLSQHFQSNNLIHTPITFNMCVCRRFFLSICATFLLSDLRRRAE